MKEDRTLLLEEWEAIEAMLGTVTAFLTVVAPPLTTATISSDTEHSQTKGATSLVATAPGY